METPLASTRPEPDPSDEELMVRVQQGDPAAAEVAYHQLFERHRDRIYGYLVRRHRDLETVDDLFQETFLSVYRARATWNPERPFRPWLYGIAANAGRDHLRKVQRTPTMVTLETRDVVVHETPGQRIDLEAAIAELPETLRDAFLLGAVEGMDHNEVATALDISPANARARISRARAWLREHLSRRP